MRTEQLPDIVGNLRVDQAWGSAQIWAPTTSRGATSGTVTTHPSVSSGYAVGAGLKFNLPMLGKGDNIMAQFT